MASIDLFGIFDDSQRGLQNGTLDEIRFTNKARYTGSSYQLTGRSFIDGAVFDDEETEEPPPTTQTVYCLPSNCVIGTARQLKLVDNLYPVPGNYRWRITDATPGSIISFELPPFLGFDPTSLPNNRPLVGFSLGYSTPVAGAVQPNAIIMKLSRCLGDVATPLNPENTNYFIETTSISSTIQTTFKYPPEQFGLQYVDPTKTHYLNIKITDPTTSEFSNYGFFLDISIQFGNANEPQIGLDVEAHDCDSEEGGGEEEQYGNKTPTTSIFERLGYNYSGAGVIEFSENVIKSMNNVPQLLPDWAYEDLRTNNVGGYVRNPAANITNAIMLMTDTIRSNSQIANTLYTEAKLFKEHTDRLCGLVEIDPERTANLPHYTTAISTGKTLTYLVQQGDGYSNSACILGNFTSVLCVPELRQKMTELSSSPSKMQELTIYMRQRRQHDERFFANSSTVISDFQELQKYARMGATEKHLISNLIGTDRLRNRDVDRFDPACNTADESTTTDVSTTVDTQCPPDVLDSGTSIDWPRPNTTIYGVLTTLEKYYDDVETQFASSPSAFKSRYNQSYINVPREGISIEIDMSLYPISSDLGYHEFSFSGTTTTVSGSEFEISISPYAGDYEKPPTKYTSTLSGIIPVRMNSTGGNFKVFFERDYWGTRSNPGRTGLHRLPDRISKYYVNIRFLGPEPSSLMVFSVRLLSSGTNVYNGLPSTFNHCNNNGVLTSRGISQAGLQSYLDYYGECRPVTSVSGSCTFKPVNYRNVWNADGFDSTQAAYRLPTRLYVSMQKNNIFSIKLPQNPKVFGNKDLANFNFSLYSITAGRSPTEYEVCISECEGDFDSVIPGNTRDDVYIKSNGEQIGIDIAYDGSSRGSRYAKLSRNKEYYINIKFNGISAADGTEDTSPTAYGFKGVDFVGLTAMGSGPTTSNCTSKPVAHRNTLTNDGWLGGTFGEYTGLAPGSGGGQKLKWSMNVGDIFSIKIPKNLTIFNQRVDSLRMVVYWSQSGIMPQGANPSEYEVCISECEGDFDSSIPGTSREISYYKTGFSEVRMDMSYNPGALLDFEIPNTVILDKNKDYYFNIKINGAQDGSNYSSLGLAYLYTSPDRGVNEYTDLSLN